MRNIDDINSLLGDDLKVSIHPKSQIEDRGKRRCATQALVEGFRFTTPLMPYPAHSGEDPRQQVERMERIRLRQQVLERYEA